MFKQFRVKLATYYTRILDLNWVWTLNIT